MNKEVNLSEFKAVLCNLHNNLKPHTFDSIGEYNSSNASLIIEETEEGTGFIYEFDTYQDLYDNLKENLQNLDLTSGGDDTFFDANPANMEAIIYGLYILNMFKPEGTLPTNILFGMLYKTFEKYWIARKSGELDIDELDDQYQNMEFFIDYTECRIKSIQFLEVANLID